MCNNLNLSAQVGYLLFIDIICKCDTFSSHRNEISVRRNFDNFSFF